ncbi:alpha/beta hydrolase [Thiocystis minor]|uniref:alpha/beta fold hydrolase n=1 Tax=Thiocystis minor TaxID=61597 RepID=UPI001913B916|nr:alpha/beta hydrolase [Thiocystis minor]MBK5964160.1 alpha/beta hydrolase [Thiocystis minor]
MPPLIRAFAGALLAAAWICALPGCASHTGAQPSIEALAATHGMRGVLIPGTRFQHVLYRQGDLTAAPRIHLYLEGDGRPWDSRHRIASDPTPRDPLALRLMARDPMAALYLGRPCYHQPSQSRGCRPWLWTHGRYSQEVVESMVAAITHGLPYDERRRITLIGYSGGGVLAMLMAERLAGVDRLVTIAANLDIDAWADRHGYSRLAGSLNPVERRPLEASIRQLHLIGARDDRVPLDTIRRFRARNPRAAFKVLPDFDHRCCWLERWPSLLAEFR